MSANGSSMNRRGVPEPRPPRRSPFDIVPGQHKPKLVRNGAIFAVFALIFLYIIYTKPSLPFGGGGQTVTAEFAYAADVVPGRTPVREYGVDVGVVTGIQRAPSGNGAQVTMSIRPGSGVNLRQDASASLRWRTLLGLNYYVDLVPGSPSAPRLGDATIPKSRTSSQVEIDQALEPLNAQGRQALGTMVDQFDAGFSDPAAVRATLRSAAPAMKNLAAGLPGLRGTDPGTDLPRLLASTNTWMGALARDDASLGGMIDNGAVALGVTAANRLDLGSTFDDAPSALEQTQATMVRLRATLDTLEPIAQKLEPGAVRLARAATLARTALNAATPLLTTLKPTLAALRPSVDSLARTARDGVPVINQLIPTLNRTLATYIPWLKTTDSGTKLKEYEAVGPTLASVSSVLGYGDQYGTLAGFEAGAGENVVGGVSPCSTFITNPNVSLTKKVDCQALTQLLTSIFTGSSPTSSLAGSLAGSIARGSVPQSLVNSLLKTGKP